MALPERDMRACTVTFGAFESVISLDMALLSSSVNFSGSSLAWRLRMASGMRGPSAARAKMNSVSPGATFAASAGAKVTTP